MLETLIFQWSIAIAHKYDNFTNISKWSVLLSLKFQANTYSFERVVTLFVGYYFSSGHRVYICFVDYEKAFDRVEWRRLLHALRRMGIDWRDRRLIGNLYMGQQMRVRIDGEYSEPGKVGRGVRQGCSLSPLLFNIYVEELVREAVEDLEEGIKVGERWIKALRFADDQAMVAKSQKGLQVMMDRLDRTSREYGMKINIKKTKVLKISKGKETMLRINIGGKEIEQVKEFCYLESVITTDAKCHRDIRRRIAIGKEAFSKRRELLKVNRTLKIPRIKTLIWSVVLYGAETWTMRKADIKDLRLLKCGLGEEWRKSAGQNIRQMKKYWKRLERKDPSYAQ